jgi:SPW repeat
MRFITTKFHAVLDYLSSAFLITFPWTFNFNSGGAAQMIPFILGIMIIIMSVFTNYEAGIVKIIPMPIHLKINIMTGMFLIASPWIFNFNHQVYLPHLILGVFEISVGLLTERLPYYQRRLFRNIHP